MADLHTLIRVRRHAVEQKQKLLAALYRQAETLQTEKDALLRQLEEERQSVRDMALDFLQYFAPYEEAVKARVADLEEDQAKLEKRITDAREAMRTAFADLKKIEIIQDKRDEEAAAARAKKEEQELDETGLDSHRRAQEKEG